MNHGVSNRLLSRNSGISKCKRSLQRDSLTYSSLEPRNLLAGDTLIGPVNYGVAVADDAVGQGYMLFSEESVHVRFGDLNVDNADHFVAVRVSGIQWQYNNDVIWQDFEPVDSDLLVAEVSFSANNVVAMDGVYPDVNGIDAGFTEGDIWFSPNLWNRMPDQSEFNLTGTAITRNAAYDDAIGNEEKLSQIASAVLMYEELHDHIPRHAIYSSSGEPLLSWRVQILPFLGHNELYEQFNLNEPWDSPTNLGLLEQMPEAFMSPELSSNSMTNFLAMLGEETAFPLGPVAQLKLSQFTDHATNTILLVEADPGQAVEWTKPRDLSFDVANPLAGLGTDSFAVALADASAHTLPPTIDPANFANLVQRNDGAFVDFSQFTPFTPPEYNLSKIGIGLHNYHDVYRKLPAHAIYSSEGAPLLSWRVAILPFIGHEALFERFNLNEPWDSPNNIALLPLMPHIFAHPASTGAGGQMTSYLTISGDGTTFPIENRGLTLQGIADGAHNTIAVVLADADRATEWTKPQDLLLDPSDPLSGIGGLEPVGTYVLFADANVHVLPTLVEPLNFTNLALVNDGNVVDLNEIAPIYHPQTTLRQLAHAFHNHHDAYKRLPARAIFADDGTPLLSWRVSILPFIGESNLFDMFRLDEAWDSPHNSALIPLMPRIYSHSMTSGGETLFMIQTGDNTLFPTDGSRMTLEQISDGSSNTIMIVEGNFQNAVEWTRPQDLEFNPENPWNGLGFNNVSGFNAVFADGSTRFIPNTITIETIRNLHLANDSEQINFRFLPPPTFIQQSDRVGNNMRRLSIAIHNYHDSYKRLPARAIFAEDGTPLLSWRVAILPFIEQTELFEKFRLDEPWDSPHNIALLPLMPKEYFHADLDGFLTNHQAVVGDDTMFPTDGRKMTLGSISSQDGASRTIMFVEANLDHAVEWTKPQDINFDPADPYQGLGKVFPTGFHASFGDASIQFLPDFLDAETLSYFIRRNDGQTPFIQYRIMLEDNPATVFGTYDNDEISVLIGSDFVEVVVNGREYSIDRLVRDSLTIKAMHGTDFISVVDSEGDDTTLIELGLMNLDGEFDLSVSDSEIVEVSSGGGHDVATLKDSPADDFFESYQHHSKLFGNEFDHRVIGYWEVVGQSSAGIDAAMLMDSDGVDHLEADPDQARLVRPGSVVQATHFDLVTAISESGGEDEAILNDSPLDDRFTVRNDRAWMAGDGFKVVAEGFKQVDAHASAGFDVGLFFDTEGDDSFFANSHFARMTTILNVYTGFGFERVTGVSTEGDDIARLLDSVLADRFIGKPDMAYMTNDSYLISARGFSHVSSTASGGYDRAFLYDSDGDENLFAAPDRASLRNDYFYNLVFDYDFVVSVASQGNDIATLQDSDGDDRMYATPLFTRMSGVGFNNYVRNYDKVTATASLGHDRASLYDSVGDDNFYASPTDAHLIGIGFQNSAIGFDRVSAYGSLGFDQAAAHGSAGDDVFVGQFQNSHLRGDGFFNHASGFDRFSALAGSGGIDIGYVFDSVQNDNLVASDDEGWLFNDDYLVYWKQFGLIEATANSGGINNSTVGEIDYELNEYGNWL